MKTAKRKPTTRKKGLGNPVAIATAANALEKRAERKAVAKANRTPNEKAQSLKNKQQGRNIALYGAGAIGLFFIGRGVLRRIERSKAINKIGTNSPEGIATSMSGRFFSALIQTNAFINDWFGDGTDEEALYQLAQEMGEQGITLGMVAKYYQDIYKRDLIKDMNEIDAQEKAKFDYIYANARNSKTAVANGLTQHGYVKSNASATLYKSIADGFLESGIGGDFPRGNIITITGGTYIGKYTGKSTKDYYEFSTSFKGDPNQYKFFVKKDLAEINTIAPLQNQLKSSAQSTDFLKNY